MDQSAATDDIAGFDNEDWFADLDTGVTARLIAAAADLALVVDREGVVRDVAYSAPDPSPEGLHAWVGKPWSELVTIESKAKVEALLRDASASGPTRGREVNHTPAGPGLDLPIRFSTIRMGEEGHVLALGKDLRSVAKLQQKLVDGQMMLDREYSRMRNVETRYRLLFQLSREAILIVDDATERVSEANAAAAILTDESAQRLIGRSFADLFDDQSLRNIRKLIATTRTLGQSDPVRARLSAGGTELFVSASSFRQDSAAHILVRMSDATHEGAASDLPAQSRALDVITGMPDGFVMVDGRQRILEANPAFLALAELVSVERVKGAALDTWLGRPGVDAGLLIANLRERGSLKDFSTIIRGEFGSLEQVEVTGVSATSGGEMCFGLIIRAARRANVDVSRGGGAFRSVEQLTDLVGRVSLKELVRESSDMIEKLCIEAALKRTDDNRASAAQILGLSRQSLYSKLHRYGLLSEDEVVDDD
ncbi:MAG: transcriptional regulator PpsR [Hansschlegelia sp.]